MTGKFPLSILALALPLWFPGCASPPAAGSGEPRETSRAGSASEVEKSLEDAFNSARLRAGKPALAVSGRLQFLARQESASAAAAGQLPGGSTEALRDRAGYGTLGRLQGTLKDRGPQTGAGFVGYWSAADPAMVTDDWSVMGTGISKAADGRLFAVVLVGRAGGGGSLMSPASPPGGFGSP